MQTTRVCDRPVQRGACTISHLPFFYDSCHCHPGLPVALMPGSGQLGNPWASIACLAFASRNTRFNCLQLRREGQSVTVDKLLDLAGS